MAWSASSPDGQMVLAATDAAARVSASVKPLRLARQTARATSECQTAIAQSTNTTTLVISARLAMRVGERPSISEPMPRGHSRVTIHWPAKTSDDSATRPVAWSTQTARASRPSIDAVLEACTAQQRPWTPRPPGLAWFETTGSRSRQRSPPRKCVAPTRRSRNSMPPAISGISAFASQAAGSCTT